MNNTALRLVSASTVYFLSILLTAPTHALPPGSGSLYFVHNDARGTPQALTDEAGDVVWTAQTDPFGATEVDEDPDGNGQAIEFNVRAPGQYHDEETGLHYNYYRYYDPGTGRYLTSDPIGLKGGLNTYAYVGGNPVSRIDPDGRRWVQCDTIVNGECWVADPPVDNSPEGKCLTGSCAFGIMDSPLDLRSLSKVECDTCVLICNSSTLLFPAPIPNTLIKAAAFAGISGAAVLSCKEVCREECSQCK